MSPAYRNSWIGKVAACFAGRSIFSKAPVRCGAMPIALTPSRFSFETGEIEHAVFRRGGSNLRCLCRLAAVDVGGRRGWSAGMFFFPGRGGPGHRGAVRERSGAPASLASAIQQATPSHLSPQCANGKEAAARDCGKLTSNHDAHGHGSESRLRRDAAKPLTDLPVWSARTPETSG